MSMPKLEIKTDESGRVTYSVTEEGVLLTKEQAERIASRIVALEEFAGEMFREILLLPEYNMSAPRKHHYIDKALELGIEGWV